MMWVVFILLGVIVAQLGTIITLLNQRSAPAEPLNDPRLAAIDDVYRLAKSIDHHLDNIDRSVFEMSTKLRR
ncbi:MAG: hypothetical protein B7Y35_13225 [Sphingomonadales bacterium 28-64-96]|nr:MAG: hypothetical protein B7Y35_13225 [Sphingomonadales bacterium 28-64-96]